jgi:excisionase family DNA binding protein
MGDFLTIDEVARRWHMPTATVLRLAEQGAIPARKDGPSWLFAESDYPAAETDRRAARDAESIEDAYRRALDAGDPQGPARLLLLAESPLATWTLENTGALLRAFEPLTLREGRHELTNAEEQRATLYLLRHYTHRLGIHDTGLRVLNPPDVLYLPSASKPVSYRVRVLVANETGHRGPLRFRLASDTPVGLRAAQHARCDAGNMVELAVHLDPAYAATLFDGVVITPADAHLFVSVPKQPGLDTQSEDVLLFRQDVEVTAHLRREGSISDRSVLKFEFAAFPGEDV